MSTATTTVYTDLPPAWHKQTLYDWGRRGLRTRYCRKLPGARCKRCTWDDAWNRQFVRVATPNTRVLRLIGRLTGEWVAVARKRGAFWPVAFYLVPRSVHRAALERLAHEQDDRSREVVPF